MPQQAANQFPDFSGERFVQEIEARNVPSQEPSKVMKTAFKDLFGELSPPQALCHVGVASNGDLSSFAGRTDELFYPLQPHRHGSDERHLSSSLVWS